MKKKQYKLSNIDGSVDAGEVQVYSKITQSSIVSYYHTLENNASRKSVEALCDMINFYFSHFEQDSKLEDEAIDTFYKISRKAPTVVMVNPMIYLTFQKYMFLEDGRSSCEQLEKDYEYFERNARKFILVGAAISTQANEKFEALRLLYGINHPRKLDLSGMNSPKDIEAKVLSAYKNSYPAYVKVCSTGILNVLSYHQKRGELVDAYVHETIGHMLSSGLVSGKDFLYCLFKMRFDKVLGIFPYIVNYMVEDSSVSANILVRIFKFYTSALKDKKIEELLATVDITDPETQQRTMEYLDQICDENVAMTPKHQ